MGEWWVEGPALPLGDPVAAARAPTSHDGPDVALRRPPEQPAEGEGSERRTAAPGQRLAPCGARAARLQHLPRGLHGQRSFGIPGTASPYRLVVCVCVCRCSGTQVFGQYVWVGLCSWPPKSIGAAWLANPWHSIGCHAVMQLTLGHIVRYKPRPQPFTLCCPTCIHVKPQSPAARVVPSESGRPVGLRSSFARARVLLRLQRRSKR